ncbi:MAG: DUF4202 domain-containing protein [Thalassotalea sp.]
MSNQRMQRVISAIDEINQQDPNTEIVNGDDVAKELIYGQRMSECLNQYWPDASEYLQIAVRAQHIKRWHLKRAEFPEGKAGYLTWRKQLGLFHAELTQETMLTHGYSAEEAEQSYNIVRKAKLKSNQDSQTLEDVACLVFLIHYFDAFAAKYDDEKVIDIVQKTWRKMSEKGHDIALTLTLPEHLAKLVGQALA